MLSALLGALGGALGWIKGKLGALGPLLLTLGVAVLGLLALLRRADRRAAQAESRADYNAEAVRRLDAARKDRADAEDRIRTLDAGDVERQRLRDKWTDRGG